MQHKNALQPKFIPFYAMLGEAIQESQLHYETLLLGAKNYAGDQIWPSLFDNMQSFEQDYQEHKIHLFSVIQDEIQGQSIFFAEPSYQVLFEYALDGNYNPIFDKNLTEQELYNAFIEMATNEPDIEELPLWFEWTDPETNEDHLFILYLV